MTISVNSVGKTHAKSLIASGDVDTSTAWDFTAADGNALLGASGDDWANYAKMFLAVDSSVADTVKEHYKYPFGKNGKVYRSGLIAIRQRAGQQNETDIYDAAGALIDLIDAKRSAPAGREVRTICAELRAMPAADGKPAKICGHAANFNSMSQDLGGFTERIAPGAFAKTLLNADVRALWNHDANIVLGRNKSGTLSLQEDSQGLYFEVNCPDTQLVRDMVVSPIMRGDVSQCSFGFYTIADSWENIGGQVVRTLLEVELLDVSPVTYAAYNSTDVAMRSMQAVSEQTKEHCGWANEILRRRLDLSV